MQQDMPDFLMRYNTPLEDHGSHIRIGLASSQFELLLRGSVQTKIMTMLELLLRNEALEAMEEQRW